MKIRDRWEDLREYRGKFVGVEGGTVIELPEPEAGATFPIRCGPWPNKNVGARRTRCKFCGNFVGISRGGWEIHQKDPAKRPTVCGFCLDCLLEVVEELEKGAAADG